GGWMTYVDLTTEIETFIKNILSDTTYTVEQRLGFAYGSYLTWHALIKGTFKPEDDRRLWLLTQPHYD
ncbi:TPA: hypothetical protein ACIBHH_004803, partial [Salmonella enterica subsp. enterica serovar Birkenhead]